MNPNKTTHSANRATHIAKHTAKKRPSPDRPIDAVIISSRSTKQKTSTPIGIAQIPQKRPHIKLKPSSQQLQIEYDYHLLFNHASSSTILKKLRNPHIKYDKSLITTAMNNTMSCGPYHDAKLKKAPHRRAEQHYIPGEAMSSDVAGMFN